MLCEALLHIRELRELCFESDDLRLLIGDQDVTFVDNGCFAGGC